jgi:hypothetical protein
MLSRLKLAADTYLLKLQRLKSKVLCTTENFPRCTPVNLPYVYDYITKLCRQKVEIIQNHENEHIRSTGQGEARYRKYKNLKVGSGQAYNCSND